MAKQYIFTDANELVLLLKGQAERVSHVLNSTDVQRVSFSYYMDRFLGIVPLKGRRITIVGKGIGTVEFDEIRHHKFFDNYLDMLRKWCQENRVTFYDFPKETSN